jgi:hypothetical protein
MCWPVTYTTGAPNNRTDAAEGFYRLIDAAYERRAMAVSSNPHPVGFDEIMPKTLATATIDCCITHTSGPMRASDAKTHAQRRCGRTDRYCWIDSLE